MSISNSPNINTLLNTASMKGVVNSVIRALAIVDLLAESATELGVTEISNKLNLHKSTVFRLLNTLIIAGYVQKNPETEKYRLTIHLAQLGLAILNEIDFRKVAKPFLQKLKNYSKESIHLGILDCDEVIYIDKIDADSPLAMVSHIGGKAPAYCTALGKVLLAHLSEDNLHKILSRSKFERFTSNTITDPIILREQLIRIRRQGYALDDEEHESGIRCIAVPIRDYNASVIAAVSVSGPTLRMTREKLDQMIPKAIQIGNQISQALGYNPLL